MKLKSMATVGPILAAALATPSVEAGGLELSAYLGSAMPTYRQAFQYDTGLSASPLPGVTLRQTGAFELDARSGTAFGAAASLYLAGFVGVEARVDTADVALTLSPARFLVTADLPPPLPDVSQALDLAAGSADLERLRPVSLNLKLRTPGPVRLTASGGVSYLPGLRLTAAQPLGIGVVGGVPGSLQIATLAFRAEAVAEREGDEGRLGLNAGVGVQIGLGGRLALVGEGRVFVFREHRVRWSRASDRPLSALERTLADELEQRLSAVTFRPTVFQAVAGVAVTF